MRTEVVTIAVLFAAALFAQQNQPPKQPPEKQPAPQKTEIKWLKDFDAAKKQAAQQKRLILILFTNPATCPPCRLLEKETLPNEKVIKFVMEKFVPFKPEGEQYRTLCEKFKIRAIPTLVVATAEGKEIGRFLGYRSPDGFVNAVGDILKYKEAKEAAKGAPDDASAQRKFGELSLKTEHIEEAEKALKKAVELDKENAKGEKARALVSLAALELLHRRTSSKDEIKKCINTASDYIKQWRQLNDSDQLRKSDIAYLEALANLFNDAFKNNYSRREFVLEYKKRLKKYCDGYKVGTYMPRALFTLARLCQMAGESEDAKSTLKRLATDFPKTEEGKRAAEILKELKKREEKK